jgi:uncharacterized protein DUF1475
VKILLKLVFGFIFVFMVGMTVHTSLQQPLWQARGGFVNNPWAVATLYDAYFGFLTFFCWVAWRERSIAIKVVWFLAVMLLGNIAMSLYVLIQLFQLRPEEDVAMLFRQKTA